ncbi:hypothetical protein [Dyadobacter sediminis]|uniref:Uncharacterized protein n=1 Tax=Dyadobacter sediminis TaxID=1493691 RepID=A0A5R9KKG6_9BACT|nr:hypothetical protein [Dyadobacter sediminis]TLU96546.1 hypothetical protein FEM55_05285 [Dyadobacter sediminis]GGB83118.1 hypothetical protein GCM10011325_08330 [Dyadobacter sediminis]
MPDVEKSKFIKEKFRIIQSAKTIEELISIENSNILRNYKMDAETYPKIGFMITPNEIKILKERGVLSENYELVKGGVDSIEDPLTKILYAMIWKNGDLKKIKHIIRGAAETSNINSGTLPDDAIVFYQFGKYLSGKSGEPIIDQHVLRAFGIFKASNLREVAPWRTFKLVTSAHHDLIKEYIDWLSSDIIQPELRAINNYSYYIDRVLFALGKYAKR